MKVPLLGIKGDSEEGGARQLNLLRFCGDSLVVVFRLPADTGHGDLLHELTRSHGDGHQTLLVTVGH